MEVVLTSVKGGNFLRLVVIVDDSLPLFFTLLFDDSPEVLSFACTIVISVDAPAAALSGAAEIVEVTATFLRAGSFSLIPAFAAVVVGDRRMDDAVAPPGGGWLCCRSIGILDRFILLFIYQDESMQRRAKSHYCGE